jgi:hypothetical protein
MVAGACFGWGRSRKPSQTATGPTSISLASRTQHLHFLQLTDLLGPAKDREGKEGKNCHLVELFGGLLLDAARSLPHSMPLSIRKQVN